MTDIFCYNRCETVAIGNGTACRETETFLSGCIERGEFKPLNVVYWFVTHFSFFVDN